jgi:hypothetical protein
VLSNLFRAVIDEAEKNPEFEARLLDVLAAAGFERIKEGGQPKRANMSPDHKGRTDASIGGTTDLRRASNRRPAAVLDPVKIAREGEQPLRAALGKLTLVQLHDIVADYGMDPGKLVMKWRTDTRVIDRIVEISLARARKGDAFRETNKGRGDHAPSIQECRQGLVVECSSSGASFWLGPNRATYGLSGASISFHNHLPFEIEITLRRLEARIDSSGLLDSTLNSSASIGPASSYKLMLPELALTDRQAQWLTDLKRDSVTMDLTLHWSVRSSTNNWEQSQQLNCAARIATT